MDCHPASTVGYTFAFHEASANQLSFSFVADASLSDFPGCPDPEISGKKTADCTIAAVAYDSVPSEHFYGFGGQVSAFPHRRPLF